MTTKAAGADGSGSPLPGRFGSAPRVPTGQLGQEMSAPCASAAAALGAGGGGGVGAGVEVAGSGGEVGPEAGTDRGGAAAPPLHAVSTRASNSNRLRITAP